MTTYGPYSIGVGFDSSLLAAEIVASGISTQLDAVNTSDDTYTVVFDTALSTPDEEIFDTIRAGHELQAVKAAKNVAIDAKTEMLIADGFSYDGSQFSLSIESQINWTNIGMVPTMLTYPYKIATLLDDSVYTFQNATEVQTAYGAAVGRKEWCVGSGRELKEEVIAAATVAEVNAVVDER